MTHEEFVAWLRDEVRNERMTASGMDDLLGQKSRFDNDRPMIEAEFRRRVVGYVAGERLVAGHIHALIAEARAYFPDRLLYFEPVGFTLL